ncbi:MAG: tRNA (guanosine(46)-N7)-methyltransferase TrmB [Pontiellaceae bacterium]|nr:tRNA (guanosine(46)-N7)-methyltransferase TrmB [Pontiellaceae bacterium]
MSLSPTNSLRIFPEQWLDPIDFRKCFEHPEHPFEIDLGCGKGRFLLARARKFPKTNFLGIDRLLNRIKRIDRKIVRQNLLNTRVLRADGYYTVTFLVPPQSVETYYVFYPDPWPKGKHHHNRIFNEPFMDAIARTLKPGGKLHAATDHLPYFEKIHKLIKNDARFEETEPFVPSEDETSDFELIFADKTPGRCSFVRK